MADYPDALNNPIHNPDYEQPTIKGLDGKEYPLPSFGGGDGYKVNNWLGIKAGTQDQVKEYIEYVIKTGQQPSKKIAEEKLGMSSKQYDNVVKDFNTWARKSGFDLDEYQESPEVQKVLPEGPESPDEPYFWDEAKIDKEGTKENDLYDFYTQMGQAQGQVAETNLARSERDMQMQMAGQRNQLMDEVRKRRQNQLRSGLSSAQIANEEIQMLLMGQQQQQQTAQGYYDQQLQVKGQQQMNPYNARLGAAEHMRANTQTAGPIYTAGTADGIKQGQLYGQQTNQYQQWIDQLLSKE